MKRYGSIFAGLVVVLLLLLALTAMLDIDVLNDPEPWMRERSGGVALVGVGLLLADVVFPVPSSFVMTAHGRLFGPVLGTLLSLAGSIGLTMVSYSIGLAGGRWMKRVVPETERAAVERVLGRWGVGVIIVTRPLPLFAESVAVMAGASRMPVWKVLLAGFVGSLPPAVFYAIAGAQAHNGVRSTVVIAVVFVVAAGLWWFAKATEVSPTSE
jgi:uncharacterized membrane protein YdjX (TVP38/TMEM64 family)